jgi:hypothetical protein
MLPADLIWAIIGLILTLLVFSYLAGDNFLFRIVIYAFIGISAAYVTLIVLTQVLWPRLILPILTGSLQEKLVGVVGLLLSVLLSMKLSPRLARIGNIPMGYLVGVGAAVAIGGAVSGTLIPQFMAMVGISSLQQDAQSQVLSWTTIINGVMMILGTLTTLIFFQYNAIRTRDGKIRRRFGIEVLASIGKVIVAISFGAIFAGVLSAAVTAMVERIAFIINLLRTLGG